MQHRAGSKKIVRQTGESLVTFKSVIHKAIKRHAGLSAFDDEIIADEVEAICESLRKAGYTYYC